MYRKVILLLFFSPLLVFAQPKTIPLHVALFNESTALPFTRFFTTPVHPGLMFGTQYTYRQRPHTRLYQTANLSYFYHRNLAQGIGVSTELGFEYRLEAGMAFAGLFGLGYLHTFSTAEEFKFSNGQYTRNADGGNARLTPSLSIDFAYYVRPGEAHSPKIFIRYQAWAEYPYSPDFIPVMTHINLYAGVQFFIHLNEKQP